MDYPYPNYGVKTPEGFVALGANVQAVINAINTSTVIPYGDFGGPNVFWFPTFFLFIPVSIRLSWPYLSTEACWL